MQSVQSCSIARFPVKSLPSYSRQIQWWERQTQWGGNKVMKVGNQACRTKESSWERFPAHVEKTLNSRQEIEPKLNLPIRHCKKRKSSACEKPTKIEKQEEKKNRPKKSPLPEELAESNSSGPTMS
jgi:hypothetical protein